MVRQFRTVSVDPVRWAAGNAIGIVADSTVFADVADLVREPSYGVARQMPVDALPRLGGRANRSTVIEILVDLLSDDDVVLHAISAIRRIRIGTTRRPPLYRRYVQCRAHRGYLTKPMLGEPTASPAAMRYQVAPESGGRGIGQNLADHVPRLRGQGPVRLVVVGQLQTCL